MIRGANGTFFAYQGEFSKLTKALEALRRSPGSIDALGKANRALQELIDLLESLGTKPEFVKALRTTYERLINMDRNGPKTPGRLPKPKPPKFPPFDKWPPALSPYPGDPADPSLPPPDGWGPDPGGGGFKKPGTGETLRPDSVHPGDIPPHWDYTDPNGNEWRVFPDGSIWPKDPGKACT